MGNRAVITIKEDNVPKEQWNSLYLHWNGGRDQVEAFLHVAKLYGIRCYDSSYGIARLAQLIGNTIGGTLSVGVGRYGSLDVDNYDNGTYVVQQWKIVEREYFEGKEQYNYDFDGLVKQIREINDPIFNYKSTNEEVA